MTDPSMPSLPPIPSAATFLPSALVGGDWTWSNLGPGHVAAPTAASMYRRRVPCRYDDGRLRLGPSRDQLADAQIDLLHPTGCRPSLRPMVSSSLNDAPVGTEFAVMHWLTQHAS